MAERVLDIDASPPAEGQPALLDRHRDLLDHGLRKTAPRTRGLLRQMSAYHLGYTDAQGHPANDPAGKRIRPALTLWSCEALGGDPDWALPAAVAVELIHNFTLIHDDIQDGDQLRRHRPTVWTIWGTEQGINAGDGMFANALTGLLAPGPRPGRRMRAAHLLSAAVVQVVEGQCLDLSLEGRAGAAQATYLRLVTMKTGALLGAAMAAGRGARGCAESGGATVRRRGQVARPRLPGARRLARHVGRPTAHRQGPERRPSPAQAHVPGGRGVRGGDAATGGANCAGSSTNASPVASSACARCSRILADRH